ncbi:hypothetical protein KSD_87230 [Ktedonobacter sp. SOSP1-85]|nr:hypothetical protein KSD_87230 [Ktedonobacter sp. SOSP1-85]
MDRPAYTVCVVEQLHEALRHHDIFVEPSERWGDPRARLLQPEQWEGIRAQICQTLGRASSPQAALAHLKQQLDSAYRQVAAHLPTNTALQIELRDGEAVLNLEGDQPRWHEPSPKSGVWPNHCMCSLTLTINTIVGAFKSNSIVGKDDTG